MDMSKMTAEEHKKMMDECAAKKMKDCDMSGMDMSKMSAEDHQKMMEHCEMMKGEAKPKGGS